MHVARDYEESENSHNLKHWDVPPWSQWQHDELLMSGYGEGCYSKDVVFLSGNARTTSFYSFVMRSAIVTYQVNSFS